MTELRFAHQAPELTQGHITGLAAPFDKPSRNLAPGFVEMIDRRAFDASLASGENVVALFNHDQDRLLGTTQAGTLKLDVQPDGLHYDVDPPQCRADVVELVARMDVSGSSFAFTCPEDGDEWTRGSNGLPQRRLLAVRLIDVSCVTTPAYPDSSSQVRALDGAVSSLSRMFHEDPVVIRGLMDERQLATLFRRSGIKTAPRRTTPLVNTIAAKYRQLELKRHDLSA